MLKNLFWIAVIAGAVWFGYGKYKSNQVETAALQAAASKPPAQPAAPEDLSWIKPRGAEAPANPASGQSKCDGRTHCSQMTSCAEATYFLQNCPNTQMDGNNDGEPCEQQWCK